MLRPSLLGRAEERALRLEVVEEIYRRTPIQLAALPKEPRDHALRRPGTPQQLDQARDDEQPPRGLDGAVGAEDPLERALRGRRQIREVSTPDAGETLLESAKKHTRIALDRHVPVDRVADDVPDGLEMHHDRVKAVKDRKS